MNEEFLREELNLRYFHDNGYIRKTCESCGASFWTLNPDDTRCGDQPCVPFSFIGKPLGKRSFSLREVREGFLSFFEKHGHSRLHYPTTGERMPVIARWRSDIYLTIASIADFQPHVTSGIVPPPANPLVISQPCIRLNDLDQVGISGRHLTIFEMMGHHAFNKNIDEIYWKEETVKYCNEFFTEIIGIPREKITYKEQMWYGGGNAGPCLEVLAGGLEIATLVFMNLKEDPNGDRMIEGIPYTNNPLNIVDTGYGLERIAWITHGTKTVYETVFPEIIEWIQTHAEKPEDTAAIYSLADHTKSLAFMLGDGVVPSNVKAGYLARLLIRRSLRFMEAIQLNIPLRELVDLQLEFLQNDFPSLVSQKRQIHEILDIETERYRETLSKGKTLVRRMIQEKKYIDEDELVYLYDTHGIPPTVVQSIAREEGINIDIPKNFETKVASLHTQSTEKIIREETEESLPTTIQLYYQDHYMKEFDATVTWIKKTSDGTEVVLDKTAFYPEGGGQLSDQGVIIGEDGRARKVKYVYKKNGGIIHLLEGELKLSERVHGKIDWDRRYSLMKHHTGTHVINGALRTLLGDHIWQAGSQLNITEARFDYSHYKPLSDNEIKEIERLSNEFIKKNISVIKKVMDRNEAEKTYGFRLYQGGVPPGDKIRIVEIPGVDVEACGGTHLDTTGEIEKIRIIKSERIQDGVNRIIFAAGKMVEMYQKEEEERYQKILDILHPFYEIKDKTEPPYQLREAAKVFSVLPEQLDKTLHRFLRETGLKEKKTVNTLDEACRDLFINWKKKKKREKNVPREEIERLKEKAESIPGTNFKLIISKTDFDSTGLATAIVKEPGYIVHIYDGKKITSAASEDIDIDLSREIAPSIGRILGGSGGGRPRLTQSGGPNKDKADEALEKARILSLEMFKAYR